MSRTYKGNKGSGYDFWSRRCFGSSCMGYGKIAKHITKHKERQRERKMLHDAIDNAESVEGRFPGE